MLRRPTLALALVGALAPRPSAAATPATLAEALRLGDDAAALDAAEALQRSLDPTVRAAAWFAEGLIHRRRGDANLASEAFTRVRTADTALAPWGAFHEAEQDLARGRAAVAVRECDAYAQRWPDGLHVDDCAQLVPFAWAALADADAAIDAAATWDAEHPESPLGEQVVLALADAERATSPARAVARYRQLATVFGAPLTYRRAVRALGELAEAGQAHAVVPDDLASRRLRAVSLRDSGLLDEAWAAFEALAADADDHPGLARWVEAEATTFGWRCRRFDALADLYRARLAEEADPEVAWLLHRALDKGGSFPAAVEVAKQGRATWPDHRRWRRETERIARSALLAHDHDTARAWFDEGGERRGITGTRNRFYAAFSAVEAGDTTDALTRLGALVDADDGLVAEARYWRARVLDDVDVDRADADRRWILEHEPDSWYALLLATPGPDARSGRPPIRPVAPPPVATSWTEAPWHAGAMPPAGAWVRDLAWSRVDLGTPPATPWPAPAAATLMARPFEAPVPGYAISPLFDPVGAQQLLDELVAEHAGTWPVLAAVRDLTRVGLDDVAGPLFSGFYEDWQTRLQKRDPLAKQLDAQLDKGAWRQLFTLVRDHHHTTRFSWGLWDDVPATMVADARRLALPPAHAPEVWRVARAHDVDPWLVLGIMRTESLYDARAVSRAGARGPMQVMPRTGHRIAERVGDEGFHTGRLHDPMVALDYGVLYLGRLMARFDGVFPLAVASYNGGPHNVSAWMKAFPDGVPLDRFVEHIPFGETRRYVRAVSERYAAYAHLYADAEVAVPPQTLGDDARVVDF